MVTSLRASIPISSSLSSSSTALRRAVAAPGTAINAAALQQHFMRSMSLALPDFAGQRRRQKKRQRARAGVATSSSSSSSTATSARSNIQEELRRMTRPWSCQQCTHVNRGRLDTCPACGFHRDASTNTNTSTSNPNPNPNSSAITNNIGPEGTGTTDFEDAPTLAQQRGLVPPPANRLTKAEWDEAELTHEIRDSERGMDEEVCAICMDRLGAGDQVILSCSHVYHSVCLTNFEKFTRRKMDRTCPLCRCANYQKKKYSPAQALLRRRAAIKVQTIFRKYWTKQCYQTVLQQHYSSGKGDRTRAHTFFAARVNRISDKLVEAMKESDVEVDALVNETDRALELSRSIFASLDEDTARNSTSSSSSSSSSSVNADGVHGDDGDDDDESRLAAAASYAASSAATFDWLAARRSAEKRGLCDCPICMRSTAELLPVAASEQPQSPVGRSHIALLSCTHVFHERCIEAFESFVENDVTGKGGGVVIHTCPVCRAGYNRKRLIDVV